MVQRKQDGAASRRKNQREAAVDTPRRWQSQTGSSPQRRRHPAEKSNSRQIAALQRINSALSTTLDLKEILRRIIVEITNLLAVQSASVILHREATNEAELTTTYGTDEALLTTRYPLPGSLTGWVADHKRPLRVPRLTPHEWPVVWRLAEQLGATPLNISILLVPLWIQGQVVGSLEVVWNTPHEISDGEEQLLEAIAVQVAIAISHARLYDEKERALQAVKESEERYRNLFENANDAIVTFSLDGTLTSVNRGLEVMTGWSREELLGRHYRKLATPASVALAEERTRRALAREQLPSIFEAESTRKDGSVVPIEVRARFIRNPAGQPIGIQAMWRDISERRRAEEALRQSQARLTQFLDALPVGVFVADSTAKPIYANPVARQLLGVEAESEAKPETWSQAYSAYLAGTDQLYPPERLPIRRALAGENLTVSDLEVRTGEKVTLLQVTGVPIFDATGRVEYAIVAFSDISELKRLDRLKNEFISTVSHELRTPLTSIFGSLNLLAAGVAGELPAQAQELIRVAEKNSDRLIHLINDILDIAKIESGKLVFHCQPLEMAAVVEQALEANRAYGEKFGVTFVLAETLPGAQVYADNQRLLQVLTNLLSNAAKFSPAGERVQVAVQRRMHSIRVSITDQGPGISEEFRSRIFTKFAQADSSDTRQKGGTGLGLSICKAIIEWLGGQIGFETHVQVGTTFYFDLPEWQPADVDSV